MEINLSNWKIRVTETLNQIEVSFLTKDGVLLHTVNTSKEELVRLKKLYGHYDGE